METLDLRLPTGRPLPGRTRRLTNWRQKDWSRRYQAIIISQEEEAQVELPVAFALRGITPLYLSTHQASPAPLRAGVVCLLRLDFIHNLLFQAPSRRARKVYAASELVIPPIFSCVPR